uniref:1-phosphatidylinositol phosphodiesterase-like n=1 Tax=Geotrypetes seraphini TaxID=260995 RepID=A0A6P8QN88_GEOSA|nr:1-phosphatidylinositol phosphodiesterase-like [Geotrypetes seraphini]
MGSRQTKAYDSSDGPTIKDPDWMSRLPDAMFLRFASIPGTHSSVVFYGGDMYQTQTWHLSKQYEAGIRYVDIRCRHLYNTLPVHDGKMYQHQTLDNIFITTIDFLRKHSKETILMHIKEEFHPEGNSQEFFRTVTNSIRNAEKSRFWTSSALPRLGEVRGKIVILQNFDGPEMGIKYNTLNISDDFHVPTLFDIGKKWSIVESHLKEAHNANFHQLYLTVCAGGSSGAYPYSVASEINDNLYCYLSNRSHEKLRYGIIAINYPGSEMIQLIIKSQPICS